MGALPTENNISINPKNQSEAASFLSHEFGKTEPIKTFDSSNQSEKNLHLCFSNSKSITSSVISCCSGVSVHSCCCWCRWCCCSCCSRVSMHSCCWLCCCSCCSEVSVHGCCCCFHRVLTTPSIVLSLKWPLCCPCGAHTLYFNVLSFVLCVCCSPFGRCLFFGIFKFFYA